MPAPQDTRLVGHWQLVDVDVRDPAGQRIDGFLGPQAIGYCSFTPQGRMHAVLSDGRPTSAPGAPRAWGAYCGEYGFDGQRLVTKVDGSSFPHWVGGEQVRDIRFDGNNVVISPPPGLLNDGSAWMAFTWIRLEPAE